MEKCPTCAVKTQDIIANRTGPATLHFMLMPEELHPRKPSAIVELTMCQHTQQRALACVHIAHHSNSEDRR